MINVAYLPPHVATTRSPIRHVTCIWGMLSHATWRFTSLLIYTFMLRDLSYAGPVPTTNSWAVLAHRTCTFSVRIKWTRKHRKAMPSIIDIPVSWLENTRGRFHTCHSSSFGCLRTRVPELLADTIREVPSRSDCSSLKQDKQTRVPRPR